MRAMRWMTVVVATMALVTNACTGGSGGSDDGEVTLEMWAFAGGEPELMEEEIRRFEAEHPNIQINVTRIPEGEYITKVETAIAAGNPPDLGAVYNTRWLREGLILPLDDLVEEQGIDLSTYNPSIIGTEEEVNAEYGCSYEGQLYCLGSMLGAVGVFYNKDLFDAAGVPYPAPWPPMTIDEFVDTACQLTDQENGVWGAAYSYPVEVLPWEAHFSADGRTANVNNPTAVAAWETLARGSLEGCAPSLNLIDPWEQGADFFSDGQLAMVVTDLESFKQIERAGVNYGVTGLPTPPGVEPFVQTWTDTLSVFAGSDHPEEAKLFVAFNTTVGQELAVEIEGNMPVSQAVADELNWAGGIPGREEALEVVANARPAVFIPNRYDTVGALYDAFNLVLEGELSAQEALDQAQPTVQEELDSAWEAWDRG